MLKHYHTAAHMRVTAMSDGTILLVRARRLFLSRGAPCINAGMEHLPTSHQKKGQRANEPDLPA
jgi:hypothetical protein